MPFSPFRLILFIFVISLLIAVVQVGLVSIAFDRLGLSPASGYLLLFASLFGSAVNLPAFSIEARPPRGEIPSLFRGLLRPPPQPFTGRTVIAVNVGGCLIPVFFSLYLLQAHPLPLWQVLLGIGGVATISHLVSRPVPGIGIGIPIFIAPVTAALLAVLLSPQHSAPLAYMSGTLGVLIGADLMRLRNIGDMGLPMAAIGGAGTFDGIFITGIVAVLLA
jgi:uncharacterized membrane protein